MSERSAALRSRAVELGVEVSYWDVEGGLHHAPEATLLAVVEVLEADRAGPAGQLEPVVVVGQHDTVRFGSLTDVQVHLVDGTAIKLDGTDGHAVLPPDLPVGCHLLRGADGDDEESAILVVPPPTMPRAAALAGGVGLFVPAYALWEAASPMPSFAHVSALVAKAPRLGVDVVATLPLYAAFLDEPFDASPYAPVSRLHWNEVYLDDSTLPAAPPADIDSLIDWTALARRRRRQLLDAAADLDPYVATAVDRFVAERPDVTDFARFRSTVREPLDAERPEALVRRSHELAQYLAHRQLRAIEGDGRAVLALDLPIGSHPAGYETWAHGERFADGMNVGAPPDEFFHDGQDWGFPPPLPAEGRRSGHDLWRRLVARAGGYASMLRIDHVMGVQRLWWVPEGAPATDGVYVRYPREELLAVIAAEATLAGTTIVGEDLGTVSDDVADAMARWDMLGLFEEQFHLYRDKLDDVPARSVAGVRTHDMPAFAAAFAGDPTGAVYTYRRALETAVGRPVGSSSGDVLDAVLDRLARSDAYLVVADLDDLVGETAPHNVPGQVIETTWRRRLRQPTTTMLADPTVRRRLQILARRKSGR